MASLMEALFSYNWIGLFVIGIGTLFLIGEILVKARGVFAVLGITFIVFYFQYYLTDPLVLSTMLIIYFVGIAFILIDGKVINDGTLGTVGLVGMILSVGITAPNIIAGLYAIIGLIIGAIGAFLLLKVMPNRNVWNKMTLKDRLTKEAGYSSLNTEYEGLTNKTGVTITDLRPVGTIVIEGKEYSGISNGHWIEKDSHIIVTEVDGVKILVEKTEK